MRKVFPRAVLAALTTVGLCVVSSFTYATEAAEERTWYADSDTISSIEEYIEENACTEEVNVKTEAYEAYIELMNSFSIDEDGEYHYPNDYGGSYFENGNLVILRTTPSTHNFNGLGEEYNVIFRQVEYSYEELDEICDYVMDYIIHNTEYNIFYGSIDDKNNEVVIAADEDACNSEELADFFMICRLGLRSVKR